MGTRNLTMVILNEETKVTQYGQWDGYPSGQGKTALEFLQNIDFDKLKNKVARLRFFTDEEIESLDKNGDAIKKYPYLSRNNGADILSIICNDEIEITDNKLVDNSDFIKDSLFCEWAYVIDLDKMTFEVYRGFIEEPLNPEDRFYPGADYNPNEDKEWRDKNDSVYHPCKLLKSYDINALPTVNEFVDELNQLADYDAD